MQKETLKIISDVMESINLPYDFIEFKDDVSSFNEYWVGEYQENEPLNEDGLMENTFILTGTSKGSWLDLENTKKAIASAFPSVGGRFSIMEGLAVAIYYQTGFAIPSADPSMKRMQINLFVKEWKGTN